MRAHRGKKTWRWLALPLVLTFTGPPGVAQPPAKPKPPSGFSDLADDIVADLGSAWWNSQWTFRRRLTLSGPGLENLPGRVAFFQDPDPLLLFNTGRCQDQFTDLRIVTGEGAVLPAGVIRFGRDDGSCLLWCQLPERKAGDLYLYYGNTQAKPYETGRPARLVPPEEPTIVARLGAEETAKGARPPKAPAADWLQRIVAIEAESFVTALDSTGKSPTQVIATNGASCGALLTLRDREAAPQSALAQSTVDLESAGSWQIHVRRYLAPKSKPQPFQLRIDEKEFLCGLTTDAAGGFEWESFAADLEAGVHKVELQITGATAADCLIFTRDSNYRPDFRDVSGPVWMRFKLLADEKSTAAAKPFFADWYCVHTPYSERGMLGHTACLLFRDEAVAARADAKLLAKDPHNLVEPGQWSAWGRSLHSTNYTWFSEIRFLTGDAPGTSLGKVRIAWQAATRPDAARAFHEGIEQLGESGALRVRMPTGLDFSSLGKLESFGEWSQRRFEIAERVGFRANEGPKSLTMATMADGCETPTELEYLLKTCNWLGLNTVATHYPDQRLYAELAAKYHIPWSLNHPFFDGFSLSKIKQPQPGTTYLDAARAAIAEYAEDYFRQAERDQSWPNTHQKYGLLGDEIGPAISSLEINSQPLAKSLLVEYLENHDLKPDFFGLESWSDLRAIDYIVESDVRLQKAVARQRLIEQTELAVREKLGQDLAIDEARSSERPDGAEILAEENDRDKPATVARPLELNFQKRTYHWTQKFRSDFTCEVYRLASAAVKKHSPAGYQCSVNLQAMPAQAGQMWDGGLNIFDLGRRQAFDSLYTEDWTGSTYHVAFAMGLLRAAGRKHGQDSGSYVVGDMPKGRIVANLSQGSHTMVFYLYGPVHRIGPVWGENPATMKDLGEALRLAARCESDLLAAKNRPADVALLVANTSEINDRFLSSGFGGERIATMTALADAQIPVDIIGEEEVVEDDILSRYRALYVCDPHVDSRAQQRIKEWVAAGGVLWAAGSALARQEYDEPSTALDEVFGLQDRGPIESRPPSAGQPGAAKPAQIQASKSDLLPALKFVGSSWQPHYKLSSGKALATFADGSPAIVHNQFRQGRAFLNAFPATNLATHDEKLLPLVATAARIAGARQHVRGICPELYTCVHDGPEQTVVYLFNESAQRTQKLDLEVAVPQTPQSAFSGRSGKLTFKARMDSVVVPLDLPPREAEILVFRY